MTYHFPKKILGSHMSLTYKRLMKILRRPYGKSYENLAKFHKSGPRADSSSGQSAYLSICSFLCNAVTFESLHLKSSFFGMLYRSGSSSRSSSQGRGHRSKNVFASRLFLTELQKIFPQQATWTSPKTFPKHSP